ncbi:MAG: radical SAM protein [Myxococcaceae bacterium]|nr:radical SAM protein [Myxococcaceae bacterium]
MLSRFTLRVEQGSALLYDRASRGYTRRSAAEAFLMVASRDVGLPEAKRLLGERMGAVEASSAHAVLREVGALKSRGAFGGRVVELQALAGAFGAPLVVHLGMTLACNFACAHCYSSSGKRLPDELTLAEIEALIDQMHAAGICKLVLGGGEPFLRRELPAVIRYADARGIDCYVHTNASLLRPAVLEELSACPPAGLQVSLEGSDASLNDPVRGPGTFAKALEGLKKLRASYAPGFNLSVTVGPHNVHDAAAMVELAKREEAHVLLLRPAYPAGIATGNAQLHCDRPTFIEAVKRAKVRAAELGVTVDAPDPVDAREPDFEGFGCVAARVVLGVTPNGSVTPCLNLPVEFETGNVKKTPLLELWQRGRSFVSVRAQQPNAQCSSCKHYDTCRGGCRVRALFAGNGLNGPDSWCHYEPKATLPAARSA